MESKIKSSDPVISSMLYLGLCDLLLHNLASKTGLHQVNGVNKDCAVTGLLHKPLCHTCVQINVQTVQWFIFVTTNAQEFV